MAHCVPRVGSEDIAELTQDSIAIAAAMLSSAEARGKKVSAGNICCYATKLIRQGQRSTGQSKTDVMHPEVQRLSSSPTSTETSGKAWGLAISTVRKIAFEL
jgi:hypothetical protein